MKIPDGWKIKKFADVATIANGQVSPLAQPFQDYLHIGPENVESGTGKIKNLQTAKELKLVSGKYLFDADSIVYSKIRPNLNKVCIPDFIGICSADMYPIHTIERVMDKRFLFQFMLSDGFLKQSISASMRTGMPKVNRTDLNSLRVPVPPLEEQRAIAEILSTWDEGIRLVEQLIAAKEQRKRGLMQRLLTGQVRFPGFEERPWREVHLADVAQIIMGQSPSSANYNQEKIGLPLIQGNADIADRKSSPRNYTSEITKECQANDIILSIRAPVGETALSIHHACIGRGVCAIRPTKVHGGFLFQLLVSVESKWQKFAQGSTFTAINSTDIKNFKIIIPETGDEQRRIAAVLQACDEEIALLRQKLAALQRQKKGLMQRLLTGQVRVPPSAGKGQKSRK